MRKQNDIEQALDQLVGLLLSDGELTAAHREALFRWLDSDEHWDLWFDALERHYEAHPRREETAAPDPEAVSAGWREVARRLGFDLGTVRTEILPLRRPVWRRVALRVATVLLPVALGIGGWFVWQWSAIDEEPDERRAAHAAFVPSQRLEAHADSVRHVTLPCGTRVTLNKNATFAWNDERECELHGEAWFRVAENADKPFVIHSEHFTVRAHTTEFHIDTHGAAGASRVALYAGAVELLHSAGSHLLEAAGRAFTLHLATQTPALHDFDHTAARPAWSDPP